MSVREIIQEGNIILRLKADKIEIFDKNLHALLDDMHETMISANGIGLAAPQIGISKRVIVVSTNEDEKIEIVNPEIVKFSGMQIGQEGCLSVDSSKNGNVKDHQNYCKRFDRNGKNINKG